MHAALVEQHSVIAVLGRRDQPTDGVEDYCTFLGQALAARGITMDIVRISPATGGRFTPLHKLWQLLRGQRGRWVLVQYTALAWSHRGFPWLFLFVLWLLRIRQARIAIVFHDPMAYQGRRLVDRVRRFCQLCVMRRGYGLTDKSIFPVPLEQVSWLPRNHCKAFFIPVGSNIPALPACRSLCNGRQPATIAVFGVTGDGSIGNELSDIAFVARTAAERLQGIRLTTVGRGSKESEVRMRRVLEGRAVAFSALGVLPAVSVSKVLADAHVSLFVRGPISTQRTTAIASIACGTPLVAYSNSQLPKEFSQAGVVGVGLGDRKELAEATITILTDSKLRLELLHRNRIAFETYFSWEAIAARFTQIFADA